MSTIWERIFFWHPGISTPPFGKKSRWPTVWLIPNPEEFLKIMKFLLRYDQGTLKHSNAKNKILQEQSGGAHLSWGQWGQHLCELHPQTERHWGPVGLLQVYPGSKVQLGPTLKQRGHVINYVSYVNGQSHLLYQVVAATVRYTFAGCIRTCLCSWMFGSFMSPAH